MGDLGVLGAHVKSMRPGGLGHLTPYFNSVVDLSLGEVGGLTKEFHQLGLYLN